MFFNVVFFALVMMTCAETDPPGSTCASTTCLSGFICEETKSGPRCVKPGICPTPPKGTVGICVELCSSDVDCTDDAKCCSNGCGHVCRGPIYTSCATVRCKNGYTCWDYRTGPRCDPTGVERRCPPIKCLPSKTRPPPCKGGPFTCTEDRHCLKAEKCCKDCYGCGHCTEPVFYPPPPSCKTVKCKKDHVCILVEVVCVKAPCYPQPQCVHYCFLPPDGGLCLAYFPSWYYDVNSGICKPFIYGGCGGNLNRFGTKKACQKACGRIKCPQVSVIQPCKMIHHCSKKAGGIYPVCPPGRACCETKCGWRCLIPIY